MLNLASKALLAISGAALVMGLAYQIAGGERTGVVILLSMAIAVLVVALATAGRAVHDLAPVPEPDTTPTRRPVPAEPLPAGTAWPLAAAAALALMVSGAAFGIEVLVIGVLALLVAVFGWFGKVWSEHPTWTRPVRQRVSSRLLVPVGLPVGTFLLALVIAVSTSRVLLAVSKEAAVFVALIVAVLILAACAWVASRPRLGPSVIIAMSVLAATSMVGAGIAGAVSGEREFHPHKGHEGEAKHLKISAKDLKFDKSTLTVPARDKLVIEFENDDPGVYHNVAVYAGGSPEGEPIFNGAGFPGHAEREYEFTAPEEGTYLFICDFHPNQMKGNLVAQPV